MEPINYMASMPQQDLGSQIRNAIGIFGALNEIGNQNKQIELQQKAAAQADEQRKAYASDLQSALQNPTQATWASMIAKYPQAREAFGDASKMYTQQQKDAEFYQGIEVSNALESGNVEAAKGKLQTIIAAKENAGEPVGIYKQVFDRLNGETPDIKGAQATANMVLSHIDPDKFIKIADEKRKETLAPIDVKKKTAEAETAALQAGAEPAKLQSEQDKRAAEAIKAQDEASPEALRIAQKKRAADLGLTNAQIAQHLAMTRKLNADTQKALLEAKTGDPSKNFDAEFKLRKEYVTQTQPFQDVLQAHERMKSTEKTGPGDITLIYSFMKVNDPGSVVREGEFATAQNSSGVPDTVRAMYNKILSGERLTDKQRASFLSQADKIAKAAALREKDVRTGLNKVVKNYGLNADNVFGIGGSAGSQSSEYQQPAGKPKGTVEVDY